MANAKELEKELEHFTLPVAPETPPPPQMNGCIGSYSGCTIFWNGEMDTCISMSGRRSIKPFEIGFEAAWQEIQAEHEATFRLPDVCAACEMRADCMHNCAARRFEGTGASTSPDPFTCKYTYLLRIYRERMNNPEIPHAPSCS